MMKRKSPHPDTVEKERNVRLVIDGKIYGKAAHVDKVCERILMNLNIGNQKWVGHVNGKKESVRKVDK